MLYVCVFRYYIPRTFLKPKGNVLVILEEEGGFPPLITIEKVATTTVCGQAKASDHFNNNYNTSRREAAEAVHLYCPPNRVFTEILFASYGTPNGGCDDVYSLGLCDSPNSRILVEKVSF